MVADLFLYHYECNYKNNSLLLHRYIDDIVLNSIDNANFSLPVIHSAYLALTFNNLNNNVINFLNLKILLHNNKIFIDIYDKREDFSFQVNIFTGFNSCLHLSVYRNILFKQLFRIKKMMFFML